MNRLFHMSDLVQRTLVVAGLLVAVLAIGTLGFHLIEDQGLFESFYMAVITLSTVGYAEVIDLSPAGRYFNVSLILTGVIVVFGGIGVIAESLLRAELLNYFEARRIHRMIDKTSGHFIVCGMGRVGRGVIDQLRRDGAKVVAIDIADTHHDWARESEVPMLVGDAALDDTLVRAGARRAKGLVAATSSDAENVYITLSARVINPELRIVARAYDEEASKKLIRAGAHTAFAPHAFTGYRLAQALLRPQASGFIEFAAAIDGRNSELDIAELPVTVGGRCANRTLAGSGLARDFDLIVLALVKESEGEELHFNPSSETLLEVGDLLIVMGKRQTLASLREE